MYSKYFLGLVASSIMSDPVIIVLTSRKVSPVGAADRISLLDLLIAAHLAVQYGAV